MIKLEDAFIEAAEYGHLDCVKVLLEVGVDVNGTGTGYAGYEDITALMNASGIFPLIEPHHGYGGCEDCVKLQIDAGADVNKLGESGATALMAPAFNGSSRVLRILLNAGAYVNVVDEYDNTALSLACEYSEDETCIEILNAAGADVDDQEDSDFTESLKHLCRKMIRKHLLEMSPVNLFC